MMRNFFPLFLLAISLNATSQQTDTTNYSFILTFTDSSNILFIENGDTVYGTYKETFYSPVWYTENTLSINKVTATIYSCASFFFNIQDSTSWSPKYIVPNNLANSSIKSSFFNHGLWLSGTTENGDLRTVSETYKQLGESFWHGPIADNYDSAYDQKYNKVWKIDKDSIDYHLANYESENYAVPLQLQEWPAHGNVNNGEAAAIAPYVNVGGSWMFEPLLGDYPKIEGDQALFVIFNDERMEQYSKLSSNNNIGVEIHALFYAFDCDEIPSLNQSTFVNYTIYNRSESDYTNFKIGINLDMDLGYYLNNYSGCDTNLNLYYNYSQIDTNGDYSYVQNPPSAGVKILNEDIKSFISYYNNYSNYGNPENKNQIHNYLNSKWKDNSPLTFGSNGTDTNSIATYYMYPSNPNDTSGWSMYQADINPSDMRCIGSIEPFTFESGTHKVLNASFIFAWDSTITGLENVNLLLANSQHIQDFYDGVTTTNCTEFSGEQETVSTPQYNSSSDLIFKMYPNPTLNNFYLHDNYIGLVKIYNSLGKKISETKKENTIKKISAKKWAKGMYFIVYENNKSYKLIVK